jgi:hypothetical protein
MKKKKSTSIVISLIILAVAVLIIAVYFTTTTNYGILQGKVVDEYSQDVVKKLHLTIDGKSDILFMSKDYRITRIPPGKHTFKAEAPYYEGFSQDIGIKKGINVLDFAMKGKEIPGLSGIICFADPTEQGIEVEIRFKNEQGQGISDYPALPLTLEGKLYVREGDENNYNRGRKLFEGPMKLFWDPTSYLARNKAIIPWSTIEINPESEKFGIMELVLTTPQGVFEDTIENVELSKKEGQ